MDRKLGIRPTEKKNLPGHTVVSCKEFARKPILRCVNLLVARRRSTNGVKTGR